jgi:lipopolysaccharide transport system ATP-binding protein
MSSAPDLPVLSVAEVGKAYPIYESTRSRLRTLLTGRLPEQRHWALKDVSFSLYRGQCLGVVGDNGAGKSTLLKLISQTLQPTEGSVRRQGRLTAILELGAGFHPEFSGRENIRFGAGLIGLNAMEMASLEEDIIAFSELGEAIDRPVKTYSSGMTVRLAFALVTAIVPEILIIDEALAVGDQHFQKKCIERIGVFREAGCTILFCSHGMYHIRQLCDQALWLDNGRVRAFGATETVLASYEDHIRALDAPKAERHQAPARPAHDPASLPGHSFLKSVEIANLGEGDPPLLQSADLMVTVTAYGAAGEQPHIAVMLERSDGVCVTAVGTHADDTAPLPLEQGLWRAVLTFPNLPLYTGEYVVSAFLFDSSGVLVYDEWRDCARFVHTFKTIEIGLVRLPHRWS